jgi:hypothetical protein
MNGLTGNRASVNADTSDHGCPINNGDAIVRFCRSNGTLLSCWTAADNDKGRIQIHSIQTLHAERKSCDDCLDLIG